MLIKKYIYIEEDIIDNLSTKSIIKKLGNPQIIKIKHYKDVFNQSATDWRLQKAGQKIILAKRKDNFYYKGSNYTPSFGYNHFYYNTLALNCIYDCDYCYLQGLFTGAHLVLFINNNDFISETDKLIKSLNGSLYLALSYDTDLMAIENLYPYCQEWIEYAKRQKNICIEIRTKSNNVNVLKKLTPIDNVILAWTLSPQEVIDYHEAKTPNAQARIKAINNVLKSGWRVRICIDPILNIPNWKKAYTKLIEDLSQQINFNKIDCFSLGVFRMNKDFLKRIKSKRSDTPVLYDNFEIQDEDSVSYHKNLKNEMMETVANKILSIEPKTKIEIV